MKKFLAITIGLLFASVAFAADAVKVATPDAKVAAAPTKAVAPAKPAKKKKTAKKAKAPAAAKSKAAVATPAPAVK